VADKNIREEKKRLHKSLEKNILLCSTDFLPTILEHSNIINRIWAGPPENLS
jgi:hypothetical protein